MAANKNGRPYTRPVVTSPFITKKKSKIIPPAVIIKVPVNSLYQVIMNPAKGKIKKGRNGTSSFSSVFNISGTPFPAK